jgi:hypothetical protein
LMTRVLAADRPSLMGDHSCLEAGGCHISRYVSIQI